MRSTLKIMLMLAAAGVATPAGAQQAMYPGQDVTVNPTVGQGNQVLLYPGGKYMRAVPRLLEPGAPYPGMNDTVRLHLPKKHVRRKRPETTDVATAPVTQLPTVAEALPPPPPVQKTPPKKVAAAQPQKQTRQPTQQPKPASTPVDTTAEDNSTAAIPFSLSATRPMAVQSRQPQPDQTPPPKQQPQQPQKQQPPTQVALAVPPPVQKTPAQKSTAPSELPSSANPNLSKHGQIKFRKDATDLVPAAMDGIRLLANDLNSALDAGAQRVQLEAYGGPKGDKSSDSRRLSLKRALTIRQLLINDGVPSSKIDVRAMGGASDGGAQDRVDVFVRA